VSHIVSLHFHRRLIFFKKFILVKSDVKSNNNANGCVFSFSFGLAFIHQSCLINKMKLSQTQRECVPVCVGVIPECSFLGVCVCVCKHALRVGLKKVS